ncbi:type II secretion system minor pseudopilin GspH [Endozoicomonas elysicola]|nr:type II secretion system minor pseudopilin GspH [Endozoicomonas elysicola]
MPHSKEPSACTRSSSPHKARQTTAIQGFTLLEIMLVMVLLGLAISAILPSLIPDDSGALMQKEARRLVMLTQSLQEQALISGQDMGLQQTHDGYRFLVYQQGKWQPVTDNRTLSPVALSSALRLAIFPGESVWRDTLELEKDKGFTFDFSDEEASPDSNDESKAEPDLFFWASGDISPAELRIFSTAENSSNSIFSVNIEEHGAIALVEGAER